MTDVAAEALYVLEEGSAAVVQHQDVDIAPSPR